WKQKIDLKLNEGQGLKPLRIQPFGLVEDLMPYFDESRGDRIIDLGDMPDFTMPVREDDNKVSEERRQEIQIGLLFGSNKPFGQVVERYQKSVAEKRLKNAKFIKINLLAAQDAFDRARCQHDGLLTPRRAAFRAGGASS
ncbi:MAG: hypothetical protein B7Z02_14755, partial [Rhodobacterales bacterium 32-67-9]